MRRSPLTNGRWFLALGVWLLLALVTPGSAAAGSTGQPIDLGPDSEGFQLWYTIGADGWALSSDEIVIGGSIGQGLVGDPNPLADLWVTTGFWAPSVCYDTTDVEPADSTDVEPMVVTGIDDGADVPITGFSLAPVWPNPSHGVATIGWTVPRASDVRLTVLDVQGRQAETLANGNYPAGRYRVRWNARAGGGAASGVYFIRLETPDGLYTRRVAIVR